MSFRLQHQDLSIRQINFAKESLEGITKLVISPLDTTLKTIELNCNGPEIKNILIHKFNSENEKFKANYEREDDDLISIKIPLEFKSSIARLEWLTVIIHFTSCGNKCGLQFVIGASGQSGSYMYCTPYNNGTGSVFPCIEFNQMCEWWIEIISPDKNMIVLASGNFVLSDENSHIFHLTKKCSARNISFFVGEFEFIESDNLKMGYYCPYDMVDYVKSSVKPMSKALDYLQTNFQVSFPFENYKCIFVEFLLEEYYTASTMSFVDIHLLHNNRIMELIYHIPYVLTSALCEQFFGAFVEPKSWTDSWLCYGLAHHMGWEFVKETYFEDQSEEPIHQIKSKIDDLVKYECKNDGIVLDAASYKGYMLFDLCNLRMMPPKYKKFYRIKSELVMRSLVLTMSLRGLCEVFRTYFGRGVFMDSSILNKMALGRWRTVINNLITKKGHINIAVRAEYQQRSRNIKLLIAQIQDSSSFYHSGPVKLRIQEPDSVFNVTVQLKPVIHTIENISTNSKWNHLKTGQKLITKNREKIEVPIICWVHLDPELRLIGSVFNDLSDEIAQSMTKHETDVYVKFCGLKALDKLRDPDHLKFLQEQIINRRVSTRIRLEAIRQLKNALIDSNNVFPRDSLKNDLVDLFCEKNEPNPIIKMNCWKTMGDYLVHLALIEATSLTYVPISIQKWIEIFRMYRHMLSTGGQFTDFSSSRFRAVVIDSLTNLFLIANRLFIQDADVQQFVDILNKNIILEMISPSHHYCVMAAILRSLARLDQADILGQFSMSVYLSYDDDDNEHLRLAGVSALLSYLNDLDRAEQALNLIIKFLSGAEVPDTIRCKAVILIADKFESLKHSQNIYFIEKLFHIFSGFADFFKNMVSNNLVAHSLRRASFDLLVVMDKYRCPITKSDFKLVLDNLDSPKNNDNQYGSRLVLAKHDGNLSDDSD